MGVKMRVTNVRTSRSFSKENVDPQVGQPAADSSPAAPAKRKRSVSAAATASTDTSAGGEKKKRRTSAAKPRTLSKEELADLIAREQFWQKCEADEGDGDGYQQGTRGDPAEGVDPVYDDCNEVRRKITAFFKTGRMTQAAWCRLLGVSSSSLLQVFMKKKGPAGGSGSSIYPAAARFFESLRLLERRPKTPKRLKEEAAFGRYGRITRTEPMYWARADDQIVRDELGRIHVIHPDRG